MPDDWQISKSRSACARCGKEFPAGRTICSCLIEQADDFRREDYCPPCWHMGRPADAFCFWRTRRPAERGRKPVVNADLMLEFFDRLQAADTERKRVFRFVLALYLMRRKELKLLGVKRGDGAEVLAFSRRSNGEMVQVANPGLTEDQVQETAAQLSVLLNAGL